MFGDSGSSSGPGRGLVPVKDSACFLLLLEQAAAAPDITQTKIQHYLWLAHGWWLALHPRQRVRRDRPLAPLFDQAPEVGSRGAVFPLDLGGGGFAIPVGWNLSGLPTWAQRYLDKIRRAADAMDSRQRTLTSAGTAWRQTVAGLPISDFDTWSQFTSPGAAQIGDLPAGLEALNIRAFERLGEAAPVRPDVAAPAKGRGDPRVHPSWSGLLAFEQAAPRAALPQHGAVGVNPHRTSGEWRFTYQPQARE